MQSENEKITRVDIETTMKTAYIDYAMSVIVARALPDVRDGLKPVQRRIMYAMNDMGLFYNTAHKKSATVVGEVLGKYHPHGDTSVYGAVVRLAQSWNMRYTLIDGQGNFGSIDGDSAAAMRYTEVRMKQIANELLADINEDTVDMVPTYDNDREEPSVLPTKIPNLLITPHRAGFYDLPGTLDHLAALSARNLKAWLTGGDLTNVVDFSTGYKK